MLVYSVSLLNLMPVDISRSQICLDCRRERVTQRCVAITSGASVESYSTRSATTHITTIVAHTSANQSPKRVYQVLSEM